MTIAAKETLILKHYRNIQKLSLQQLEAIKKENSADAARFIEQKQLIIEHIKKSEADLDYSDFSEKTLEQLRQLLSNINAMDAESQQCLYEKKENTRSRIVASQKGKILRQAYEASLGTGSIVNRSK